MIDAMHILAKMVRPYAPYLRETTIGHSRIQIRTRGVKYGQHLAVLVPVVN